MAFCFYEFSNLKECNLALIAYLDKFIKKQISLKEQVFLALSGGKSPKALFELLSEMDFDWKNINISLVDERIVALESKDSNSALVKKYLLQNLAKNAHFIPLFKDINLSEEDLVKSANANYKQADLAILGMGLDGHTASLFAQAPEFEHALKSEENIVLSTPKNVAYKRLSMSLKALERTKKLILILQGEEKRKIFKEASLGINSNLPVSYILHSIKVDCDVYYSK